MISIDPEFKSLIPPLTADEYEGLRNSILSEGCRDAIITWNGVIVDGHNRYEICTSQNIPFNTQEREFNTRDDAIIWISENQLSRRNLPIVDQVLLRDKIREVLNKRGKENISANEGGTKPSFQISEKRINATKEIAGLVGVSHDTVSKVWKIKDKAPEKIQDIRDGKTTINRVYNEIKQKEQQDNKPEAPEFPQGKYRCIVIDPPWDIKKVIRDERPNQGAFPYATLTDEEIKALPIQTIADENCHLYLWTTHKKLPAALEIVKEWGFKYQCLMTWVKNVGFTPFSWMYSTEHVLFCKKGNLDLLRKGMRLDFSAKVREHSRKPDEFYNIVLEASPGPAIDLFSRELREGFDTWGLEKGLFQGGVPIEVI
jgi:N6-adenosine-specific RNA methylase IME4